MRVTVQLVDATTDAHLWAETYDRELTAANIFAIQSEVAAAIADALKATLTPAEQARAKAVATQNLQAWEAYQLGKQRMAKRASADLADAEQFFRKAIDLDPKFALAYVGLADTLDLQVTYSGAPKESTLGNAREGGGKGPRVGPETGRSVDFVGLNCAGQVAIRARRIHVPTCNRAQSELRTRASLVQHNARSRRPTGRGARASAASRRARPLVRRDQFESRQHAGGHGPLSRSRGPYRRAITIDPSSPGPYVSLALLNAYALDRFTDAVPLAQKAMELDPGNPSLSSIQASLYLDLGDDRRFIETITQAAKRWPDDSFVLLLSAIVNLIKLDGAGAVRHAQRGFDLDPRGFAGAGALAILRNADLQNGRYDAALARYEKAYPELFVQDGPRIDRTNYAVATDLALVLQKRGERERADALLNGVAHVIRTIPQLGVYGYGITDVQIHALRGEKAQANAALREAERAGWRQGWRYYRDFDPNLAPIRNEPEFKAMFADIERDMRSNAPALPHARRMHRQTPRLLASVGSQGVGINPDQWLNDLEAYPRVFA